jgi:hypothetical protein
MLSYYGLAGLASKALGFVDMVGRDPAKAQVRISKAGLVVGENIHKLGAALACGLQQHIWLNIIFNN